MVDSDRVTQAVPDRDAEWQQLQDRASAALDSARRLGADASAVSLSAHQGLNITVRLGEIEVLEHTRDRGIGVTVYLGRRKGVASSGDLSSASITETVERALDIARYTQEDSCNGLPDAERLATDFPDLDVWHPRPMDVAEATERALEIEHAGRQDKRINNSEGASVSASSGLAITANSLGFMGCSSGTRYSQNCVLIAGEGDSMQRDYWYDSCRNFEDLEAPEATGMRAAERTLMRLDARKLATCKAPILFSPEVARGLVGHLVGAASGSQLYRDASFLKDAVGESLFPSWVTMLELPHLARGPASSVFDGEGVATCERSLVEAGVLTRYILGSYSARRLGLESTGNAGGVHNLVLQAGSGPEFKPGESLVSGLQRGLLVTEVMGQGVNLLTGDYSRGASGFWIENGQISHPVEEITIAGQLRDMFSGFLAVGNDIDRRGNIQCGSILIDEMTIAGS
jgi:PmbA protein